MTVTDTKDRPWWTGQPPYPCVAGCGRTFVDTSHIVLAELPGVEEAQTCLCKVCYRVIVAELAREDAIGRAEFGVFTPDSPGSRSGTVTYFGEDHGPLVERVVVTPWQDRKGARREQSK